MGASSLTTSRMPLVEIALASAHAGIPSADGAPVVAVLSGIAAIIDVAVLVEVASTADLAELPACDSDVLVTVTKDI